MKEMKSQKELLGSIRQNESKYASAIQKKKREARKIDQQIERLIRNAIAASNKKAGVGKVTKASSNKFILTPEASLVANNFSSNMENSFGQWKKE